MQAWNKGHHQSYFSYLIFLYYTCGIVLTLGAVLWINTSVAHCVYELPKRTTTAPFALMSALQVWISAGSWTGTTLLKHLPHNRTSCVLLHLESPITYLHIIVKYYLHIIIHSIKLDINRYNTLRDVLNLLNFIVCNIQMFVLLQ